MNDASIMVYAYYVNIERYNIVKQSQSAPPKTINVDLINRLILIKAKNRTTGARGTDRVKKSLKNCPFYQLINGREIVKEIKGKIAGFCPRIMGI